MHFFITPFIILSETPTIQNKWELIGGLSMIMLSGLIGWISALINGKQERKKISLELAENNKKTSDRDRLMMDQMKGFDNKLVEISMDVLEIKNDMNFKSRLMNSMRSMVVNMMDYNVDLDVKYKHLIMQMAREFEEFALRFYYSDMRGIIHEITPFLQIDMDSRLAKFHSLMEHINPNPKKMVSISGKVTWVYFNKYIDDSNARKKIDKLLEILERNGLSPDRVIEEFEAFISGFFKELIKSVNEWEDLGKKVIVEKKQTDMLDDDMIEEIRKESSKQNNFYEEEDVKNSDIIPE